MFVTLLYYSMKVDNTILLMLGSIATQKQKPTAKTLEGTIMLLYYAATNPDATMWYCTSDMVLYTRNDTYYLSEPYARIRACAYFFKQQPVWPVKASIYPTTLERSNLHHIKNTKERYELRSGIRNFFCFFNSNKSCTNPRNTSLTRPPPNRYVHPSRQQFTCWICKQYHQTKDNKPIYICFYWIQECTEKGEFLVYWQPGSNKHGNYQTKHHSPDHHSAMQLIFLYINKEQSMKFFYDYIPAIVSQYYTQFRYWDKIKGSKHYPGTASS